MWYNKVQYQQWKQQPPFQLVHVRVHSESYIIHPLHTLLLEDFPDGYFKGLLHHMISHFELSLLKCLVMSSFTWNHLDLVRLLGQRTTLESLDLARVMFSSYGGLVGVLHSCQETIKDFRLRNWTFEDTWKCDNTHTCKMFLPWWGN
jgi:hypothetical protein